MWDIELEYEDVFKKRRRASPEALLAVLDALGAGVRSMQDVTGALREREAELAGRCAEPAVAAWEGSGSARVRVPAKMADSVSAHLILEDGSERELPIDVTGPETEVQGIRYVAAWVALEQLPPGYHRMVTRIQGEEHETLVISAPPLAFQGEGDRVWGVFLPTYALRTARDWGVGSYSDLLDLTIWVRSLGGRLVGTLPLLATFLDEPFDPSPYSPASRLFWSELFIDVERAPELERSEEVRELIASPGFRREIDRARDGALVDYELVAQLKARALELLARRWSGHPGERDRVHDYAAFRAAGVRFGCAWEKWPARQRDGDLDLEEVDPDAIRYHSYVQFLAERQIGEAAAAGAGLFMDLPLGVHPGSYDVWRERDAFAEGVSAGAPPDTFFTKGQNWGFPPLHPHRIRERGYRYPIACLRQLMRHAAVLRIDHMMWMHRLFWVPSALDARDGVYVRYPAEELYAILCLESHRARTAVVGEDLGTVPPIVRRAMARHGVLRTSVLQYELRPNPRAPLRPIPASAMASLNTHDMPPFAAIWEGRDIEDRLSLGLLDEKGARKEQRDRDRARRALIRLLLREGHLENPDPSGPEVLRGALRHLAASKARMAVTALEDLWWETSPQNTPGTDEERPNWRRRARLAFESFRESPEVVGTLQDMDLLRGGSRTP